jgi:hypothetical protein
MATTYSAGTFTSYICQECVTGGNIVSTKALNTPHPSYTNAVGDVVVQLQMVTLGGPNGLNS